MSVYKVDLLRQVRRLGHCLESRSLQNKDQIRSDQIKSNQIKSNQIKSNQIKSNQIKSNQTKPNQTKPNQIKSTLSLALSLPPSPPSPLSLSVQENRALFGSKTTPPCAEGESRGGSLLQENHRMSLSLQLPRTHSSVFHAGVIGQGLKRPSSSARVSRVGLECCLFLVFFFFSFLFFVLFFFLVFFLVFIFFFVSSDRLVGAVVKASDSRAEDPGFGSRSRRNFSGVKSYQ